jgi:Arc/MetJ-type ribon-helix-helix transcriptional regulator
MTIEIPADLLPFVRDQVALGCFSDEQQLVSEALRLLKVEREESLEGVRRGLAGAAAGRMQPLAEAFADLRREFNLPDPS